MQTGRRMLDDKLLEQVKSVCQVQIENLFEYIQNKASRVRGPNYIKTKTLSTATTMVIDLHSFCRSK